MLKNYILLALRRFKSERLISSINILSLSIGLASCLIIILYVKHELSYDIHVKNADRMVRVTREWLDQDGNVSLHLARVAAPIAPLLKDEFGEVKEAIRINEYSFDIKLKEQYVEEQFYFTEPVMLDMFGLKLSHGNAKTVLLEPNSIVISEQVAKKFFPAGNAVGQALEATDGTQFKVTGVLAPQPVTTHLPINILCSWATLEEYFSDSFFQSWGGNNFITYLLLEENTSRENLEDKLADFMKRHETANNISPSNLYLQDLEDIHLHSHLDAEAEPNGDITSVVIFISVGAVILLLGCFNFINLSTSKAMDRSREVGLRKVFGAKKNQLIEQFLGEAVLTTFISLVLAFMLAYMALPEVSELIGRQLSFSEGGIFNAILILLAILFMTGIIAGSYPALMMASFKPASVLRGRGKFTISGRIQKIIVVFQFSISVVLVMWVLTMNQQISFINSKDLGFNKEQLVVLPVTNEIRANYHTLKNELEATSEIESITISKFIPSNTLVDNSILYVDGRDQVENLTIANIPVGHDYFKTFEIGFLAGRDFRLGSVTDSTESIIVNERFLDVAGFENSEEAVGSTIRLSPNAENTLMTIIGVVKDFHYESLHNAVPPAMFRIVPQYFSRVTVKLNSNHALKTAESLVEKWKVYMGNHPVSFQFVDQNLQELYENEEATMTLILYFSLMAIIIACAGLLGVVVHYAENKRKEISIRKVLGANEAGVSWLMIKRFLLLAGVALLIGLPIGYLVTEKWLTNFIYHTNVGVMVFLYAILLTVGFTLSTILYHSIKAALINPATNLRSE